MDKSTTILVFYDIFSSKKKSLQSDFIRKGRGINIHKRSKSQYKENFIIATRTTHPQTILTRQIKGQNPMIKPINRCTIIITAILAVPWQRWSTQRTGVRVWEQCCR